MGIDNKANLIVSATQKLRRPDKMECSMTKMIKGRSYHMKHTTT